MKIHHLILIFLCFFISTSLKTDMDVSRLINLQNEKTRLIKSLDTATSDAINYLARSGSYGTNTINKDKVITSFFTSLYTSLDLHKNKDAQIELELYVPVILLCDIDGYYIYYYDEYKGGDGLTYSSPRWSEKLSYYHQDDKFIYRFTLTDTIYIFDPSHRLSTEAVLMASYKEIQSSPEYSSFRSQYPNHFLLTEETFHLVRKEAIINKLEEVFASYISRHNLIAKQNGITYTFSFPVSKEGEWATFIDDVNLIVFFQGYPYGKERNYVFNKVSSSGADVMKKQSYFVEKKGWYLLAHEEDCPLLVISTTIQEEIFTSLEECANIGAFCCECIDNGARVPELNFLR